MINILFIKLGALGDVINTLPLAVNLKHHLNARIHWVVAPLSLPLVEEHPCVDRVILFDKKKWRESFRQVRKDIRSQRFDIVLDLQRILKSGVFAMTARADRRIGFDRTRCKEMTFLFPFERIPASDPHSHMLSQYLEFATYLGVPYPEARWEIPVNDETSPGLPANYIILNIGATKPANRWQPESFAAAARLIRDRFEMESILTGGPEDHDMAAQITAMAEGSAINLVGKTTIQALKDVIFHARAVVSCDTGPMHLAVALGKPTIALFGPSDPGRTGPYRGHVIQKPLSCSPCNAKSCEDPKCMEAITPEDVVSALSSLLS